MCGLTIGAPQWGLPPQPGSASPNLPSGSSWARWSTGRTSQVVLCACGLPRLVRRAGLRQDDREPQSIDPAGIAGRDAEWQARVCYALALLVEPLRAYSIDGSRLMRLDERCGVRELLALANDAEVTDLIAGTQHYARSRNSEGDDQH